MCAADNMTPICWDGFSEFSHALSEYDPNLIKEVKYRTKIPLDVVKRLQRRPGFVSTSPATRPSSILQNPRLY